MKRDSARRLVSVTLDADSLATSNPDQEHERAVAIYDLIEENHFHPIDHDGGPYCLNLSLASGKLSFEVKTESGDAVMTHILSLTPLRRVVRDYFMICDSYYAAIRTQTPSQIEAIDMGRRGLHNEAAGILAERLAGKIEIDNDTARRLFTLVAALHWKG
ncbi:UPF0262 family protein [Terrarubrum flagellatum]|uniref:UPF0262 family protein n=1 Tax=Terrirubrum flagellatum TaxID=2895980 RepID=UPI0031451D7B